MPDRRGSRHESDAQHDAEHDGLVVRKDRRMRRGALVVVGVLALTTACGGGGDTAPSTQGKSSGVASGAKQVGARADLTGFDCQADAEGTWSASGTLTNAETSPVTYVVAVSVAGKNSHVVASTTKQVAVDGGKTAGLSLAEFGAGQGKGLNCTAHVTRVLS